jgi:lysosomal acid lipase/cholesteryl ester hydrolase
MKMLNSISLETLCKWKLILYVLVTVFFITIKSETCGSSTRTTGNCMPEDVFLTFPELAIKYFGTYEEHDVITSDGYILKLHKIPGNQSRPVLLVHGLSGSSDDFIIRGNTSISVSLARAGYDVWLLNKRGNQYSRRHVTLVPDADSAFWNFTFHEHGEDVVAAVDFILEKTGLETVPAVGISQGVSSVFALGATRPEYNKKIKPFIALGPILNFTDLASPIPQILQWRDFIKFYFENLAANEVGGRYSSNKAFADSVCTQRLFFQSCMNLFYFPIVGFNPTEYDYDFTVTLFSHTQVGTSKKNMLHYLQLFTTGKFQQFDYGLFKNLEVYGTATAPLYDFTKISMDVYVLSAKNDKIAPPRNIDTWQHLLPNCKRNYQMKSASFNHVDFMWGLKGHVITNKYVIKILNEYNL